MMANQIFSVRGASVEDMKVPTRLGILEDWHIGPNVFASVHASNPSGFFVGELDGKVISHINAIKHPGHSIFIQLVLFLSKRSIEERALGNRLGTLLGNLWIKVTQ